MPRLALTGNDHGRTRFTLDISNPQVWRIDDHTLEIPRPPWWSLGEAGDRHTLDTLQLLDLWLSHHDDWLAELGIAVVMITEDDEPIKRGAAPPNPG